MPDPKVLSPAEDGIRGAREDAANAARIMRVLVDFLADLAEEDKDIRAEVIRRAGLQEDDLGWYFVNEAAARFRKMVKAATGRTERSTR